VRIDVHWAEGRGSLERHLEFGGHAARCVIEAPFRMRWWIVVQFM
jgi:hypothetical protein